MAALNTPAAPPMSQASNFSFLSQISDFAGNEGSNSCFLEAEASGNAITAEQECSLAAFTQIACTMSTSKLSCPYTAVDLALFKNP